MARSSMIACRGTTQVKAGDEQASRASRVSQTHRASHKSLFMPNERTCVQAGVGGLIAKVPHDMIRIMPQRARRGRYAGNQCSLTDTCTELLQLLLVSWVQHAAQAANPHRQSEPHRNSQTKHNKFRSDAARHTRALRKASNGMSMGSTWVQAAYSQRAPTAT